MTHKNTLAGVAIIGFILLIYALNAYIWFAVGRLTVHIG
jgi:hypothetical protein